MKRTAAYISIGFAIIIFVLSFFTDISIHDGEFFIIVGLLLLLLNEFDTFRNIELNISLDEEIVKRVDAKTYSKNEK